jgi:metallophosphoesterase superfamily enzyme
MKGHRHHRFLADFLHSDVFVYALATHRVHRSQDMECLNAPGAADLSHYDCLVISDLHLGSDICQAKLLEEFLSWAVEHCDQLVINGDIFDDLNFKRLTKRHFACLKVIRRNTDRDDFHLVWVRGNHDGPIDIISHIVGVDILDE